MEDLDAYLQNEIESINDMFEEFQAHDEELEQRKRRDRAELEMVEKKVGSEGGSL